MKPLFIFVFAFALLSACTKFGKNVTVKGRVLNPVTGQGIVGAEIWLQKSSGGYEGGYKTVKKAISDENGYYELDKLGLASYRATCQTGDHYDLGWTTNNGETFTSNFWIDVKKGKTMHTDYYTVPYGCLHWQIENINCEGNSDTMWYMMKSEFDDDFLNIWSLPITGCALIEGNGCDKITSGKQIIYVKVKRGSGTTYKYDTIQIQENGTTNFHLTY